MFPGVVGTATVGLFGVALYWDNGEKDHGDDRDGVVEDLGMDLVCFIQHSRVFNSSPHKQTR